MSEILSKQASLKRLYCIKRCIEKEERVPAAPGHCSFQTEAWLWSFGEVIQHSLSPT